jgi:thiamine biosynthesis lipoprotein
MTGYRAAERAAFPIAALLAVAASGCVEPGHVERRWTVMGTYASAEIHAVTPGTAESMIDEVRDTYERADALMSNWREDSGLARLNLAAGDGPYEVEDRDLYRCIKLALEYAKRSDGAYDPTVGPLMRLYGFRPVDPRVPSAAEVEAAMEAVGWEKVELFPEARAVRFLAGGMEIDLGGIGKGYAIDMAARLFARPGVRSGLLDLGGTVYAWGETPDTEDGLWRVGVRNPLAPDEIIAVLPLTHRAVSTSGAYENSAEVGGETVHHLMDPRTGRPAATDILAAVVVADSATEADAVSTAFFVAGSQRTAAMLQGATRIEALLVVRTGAGPAVLASTSLRGRVEFDPAFRAQVGDRIRYILPPAAP